MDQKQAHSELVHRILAGTRWAAILRFSAQVFSWLSTIIVVRFISPTDYGLNNMLQSPLEVMMLLSTIGLDIALVQSKKLEQDEIRSVFGWLLVVNGCLFLAYFFGGSLLAGYFNEPRLEMLARVLAFVFLLAPFRVIPNALLDRELKFKLRAQVELGATVCSVLLTLGLAIMGAGVWALVIGVLANRVLQAIMLMVIEPWFAMPTLNFAVAHRLMRFGGLSAASGVLAMVSGLVVSLIAGKSLGSELLGIYAVATQFAMLPLAKIMPVINQSLVPAFSKFQAERKVAGHYMEKAMGVLSLALVPAMVGMACIADPFVQVLLGEQWQAAAVPLAVLSLMTLLRTVTLFLRPVMISMGRPDLSFISNLVMLVMITPATFLGVDHGVMGLVIAMFATELVVTIVTVSLGKRALEVSFSSIARSMWPALFSAMIMAASVLLALKGIAYTSGTASLALGLGVGVASYYLALRFLFVDKLRDAAQLLLGKKGARLLSGE